MKIQQKNFNGNERPVQCLSQNNLFLLTSNKTKHFFVMQFFFFFKYLKKLVFAFARFHDERLNKRKNANE